MPDRVFIHTKGDILRVCEHANSLGLMVFVDQPTDKPQFQPITLEQATKISHVLLLLMRPEWIFGEPLFNQSEKGHNAGKYNLKPGTNMTALRLEFYQESLINGIRRLGSGGISFRRTWLDATANIMCATPPEVDDYYNAIIKNFLSNKTVKYQPVRYYISRLALSVMETEKTFPPFPEITPWPPLLKN
jgi:hypothetical protein